MSTRTLSDADVQLRDHVVEQLDWNPEVNAAEVGVTARDGVITLTGYIDTYAGKLAAERAAKSVRGVRGVANELDVRLTTGRTDTDIAADAVRALEVRATVPATVQVAVHEGHLTLTGKVPWLYQAREAEKAVRRIAGVRGVFNHITVAADAVVRDVRHRIVKALHRHADLDARHIVVAVSGDEALLTGSVTSWMQRETAEHAAASAPGISRVLNEILVTPEEATEEIC
jgi:osmotically-inducible protein OsmY